METTEGAPLPEALGPGPSLVELLDCIVMDTETTGFKVHDGHRLVEVATVEVHAGVPEPEGWSTLVHPGRAIPEGASVIHGITDLMVANAPPPEAIAAGLRYRLGDRALVFHNATFDIPFLQQFFHEGEADGLTAPVIDTLGLARSAFGSGPGAKNKLVEVCARLEMPPETAHRALGDARMTARILIVLAAWHEQHKGIRTLNELAAYSQDVIRKTSFGR